MPLIKIADYNITRPSKKTAYRPFTLTNDTVEILPKHA
jgi:hypothetical protein